jgi:serine/threonine-protein kinase
MSSAEGMPGPGDVVGDRWIVDQTLGAGNMGVVVRAHHKVLGHAVAIKFIKRSIMDDEAALARFEREARALVAIESDHVVRVLDYGRTDDGAPYMVMEHLTGRDLMREMRTREILPIDEAVGYAIQACRGLADIHALGVVHRDIKPANLFLTRRTSGDVVVKIVDFGIAKAPKRSDEDGALTERSMAIGSPHYMAPEQLRDARTVDHRADLWAIGVILHRMLAGTPPFEGSSIGALLASVCSDDPIRVRKERPEVPQELEEVILKCLAKKADDRWQTAMELARALAAVVSPRPAADARPRRDDVTDTRIPLANPPPARDISRSERKLPAVAEESSGTAKASVVDRSPARAPSRVKVAPIAALIATLALVVVVLVKIRTPPEAKTPALASAVAPAPSAPPTAITDLAPPVTSNPDAAAAYRMGMQAVRDASFLIAVDELARAAALDPSMGAAHLRSAVYGEMVVGAEPRRHFHAALARRSSLAPRDLALLDALEPLHLRDVPDVAETQRRMADLVKRHPADAEILYVSILVPSGRSPREILAETDRILSIDPKFASAHWQKAYVHEIAGDLPAALAAVARCLEIAPQAASCLRVRAIIESRIGDCAGLEADAQRMLAVERKSYRAHDFLARALYARGAPIEAVKEVYRQKAQALPEIARKASESRDGARVAAIRGDFGAAEKMARELERVAQKGGEDERADAALLLAGIYEEQGDLARAAEVADSFVRRRAAFGPAGKLRADPLPRLLMLAARAGVRARADAEAERDRWLRAWAARGSSVPRSEMWLEGWAAPAFTADEAKAALEAMPGYGPIPLILDQGWSAPELGKVQLLAGRTEEAIATLKKATAACHAIEEPFESTRSHALLGRALEGTDTAGACAAYGVVLARWGGSPRSVTAHNARLRMKTLGCP